MKKFAASYAEWTEHIDEMLAALGPTPQVPDPDLVLYAWDALASFYARWPCDTTFVPQAEMILRLAANHRGLGNENRAALAVERAELLLRRFAKSSTADPETVASCLQAADRDLSRWERKSQVDHNLTRSGVLFTRARILATIGELKGDDVYDRVDELVDSAIDLLDPAELRLSRVLYWRRRFEMGDGTAPVTTWADPRFATYGPAAHDLMPIRVLDVVIDHDVKRPASAKATKRLFDYLRALDARSLSASEMARILTALVFVWSWASDLDLDPRHLADHLIVENFGDITTPDVEGWSPSRPPSLADEAAEWRVVRYGTVPLEVVAARALISFEGIQAGRITPVEGADIADMLAHAIESEPPDTQVRFYAAQLLGEAIDLARGGADIAVELDQSEILNKLAASVSPSHRGRARIAELVGRLLTREFRYAEALAYHLELPTETLSADDLYLHRLGTARLYRDRWAEAGRSSANADDLDLAESKARLLLGEGGQMAALAYQTVAEILRSRAEAGLPIAEQPGKFQKAALERLPTGPDPIRLRAISGLIDSLSWHDAEGDTDHLALLTQAYMDALSDTATSVRRTFMAAEALLREAPPILDDATQVQAGRLLLDRLSTYAQYHHPYNIVLRLQGLLCEAAHAAARRGETRLAVALLEAGSHFLTHHVCGDHAPARPATVEIDARAAQNLSNRNNSPLVHVGISKRGAFAIITTPYAREQAVAETSALTTDALATLRKGALTEHPATTATRSLRAAPGAPTPRAVTPLLEAISSLIGAITHRLPPTTSRQFFDLVAVGDVNGLPWLGGAVHIKSNWLPRTHSSLRIVHNAAASTLTTQRHGLVVAAPTPTVRDGTVQPDLPGARAEGTHLHETYGATLLADEGARRSAFLERIEDSPRFVHLAMHGEIDDDEFQQAVLLFAYRPDEDADESDATLASHNLEHSHRMKTELAFLASCWTGQIGQRLTSEAIGFGTSLQRAGARAVIAPLWPVDDLAVLALTQRFYTHWLDEGLTTDHALAEAMTWLRRMFPASATWAAFTYSGLPGRPALPR